MLRRALFVSTLILAGTFGFANSAKAQTATTEFSGTVPGTCSLTNPTKGNLGYTATANTTLDSTDTVGGGAAATVNVSCTGGTLRIAAPTRVGTVPTANFTLTSTMTTAGGKTVTSSGGSSPALVAGDNGIATVNMKAVNDVALPQGTYNFTVLITATP